eukprot:TRINITY_DN22945_c0_g1_i1.p1 TRINITY_DN22945_c0_g1~~TRINITY_DN22945_c0_g1_i1.p1  ORF type:complete len:565 (+),score=85.51 TRINITY_DN22945_c0_g1_i1:63-1757(+)
MLRSRLPRLMRVAPRSASAVLTPMQVWAPQHAGEGPPVASADVTSIFVGVGGIAIAATGLALACRSRQSTDDAPLRADDDVPLVNWSGTHTITSKRIFSPETSEQLRQVVSWAHEVGQSIRPMGTCLSPNGLSMAESGMLSMAHLDGVVSVDAEAMTITIEGGARISQILEELQKHGLTLANFSSITEQQIGGWTQVSAHGTGARIPTVDEMVTRMKLVTPCQGELELGEDGPDPELFRLARVAMGSLGIVSEVTLRCVPRYTLHERLYCSNVENVRRNHAKLLQNYRHVRYMWIPYTDVVVVVISDIAQPGAVAKEPISEEHRLEPFRQLLRELGHDDQVKGDNFAVLREKCLQLDTLNADHVARVNRAESEFWRLSEGERIADSTAILGFECGGTQWVLENCFPAGTISTPSLADIDYVVELKETIERDRIPAASPIEQRWTSRSSSPLSPAYSPNESAIFSWVGVIMYITPEEQAEAVRQKFKEYAMRHADQTFKYGGVFHWGKIDLAFHDSIERLQDLRRRMREHFDVEGFCDARAQLDPKGILGNALINTLFGSPGTPA